MPNIDPSTFDLLTLTLVPGLGPVLIGRAVEALGSPAAAVAASETTLRGIKGLGADRARKAASGLREASRLAERECAEAERLGARIIGWDEPAYPSLLRTIPGAPPVLYVLGRAEALSSDGYPVAIVGSRSCTPYGIEQSERFAMHLAQAGLTVVSGGARGIDTAAHRGAMRAGAGSSGGVTVAVLGCGLTHRYPPDNVQLFDSMISSGGALVSELPLSTPPTAENFPARNRIISGLSLGVIVIEAGRKSGALITARDAAESHGREVFAVPGRVDSAASEGTLSLLKSGGAALVTHPADVVEALEGPARHQFLGTHAARFQLAPCDGEGVGEDLPAATHAESSGGPWNGVGLSDSQRVIVEALADAMTVDELSRATGMDVGALRGEVTMLEIQRRVRRVGTRIARV
ncbi:MAG: DNA-processing protein DprA [Phycisphaeraceae bacterium]|nr:DNA-processing protein DprA [Phycisphaeraceae bacterium]